MLLPERKPTGEFSFPQLQLSPLLVMSAAMPAGLFVLHAREDIHAPALLPVFGAKRSVLVPGELQMSSWMFPGRLATREGVLLDCSYDIAPALQQELGVVDAAPRARPAVGCNGLAVAPFIREPALAGTLDCAGYVCDAGVGWTAAPEFASLADFMRAHWAELSPMLCCATVEEYPLAVIRVVNDVPAGAEFTAMFNGFDLTGRRITTLVPSVAFKCPEGAALLKHSPTSLRDVNALLRRQDDVKRGSYVAALCTDAKTTSAAAHMKHVLIELLRALKTDGLLPLLTQVVAGTALVKPVCDEGDVRSKRQRVDAAPPVMEDKPPEDAALVFAPGTVGFGSGLGDGVVPQPLTLDFSWL